MSDDKKAEREQSNSNQPEIDSEIDSEFDSELANFNPDLEKDPELKMLLENWRTPEPPAELKSQVLSAYRQEVRRPTQLSSWRRFLNSKLPIPLSLAASILVMVVLAPVLLRVRDNLQSEPLTVVEPKLPTVPGPPAINPTPSDNSGSPIKNSNGETNSTKPNTTITPRPVPTVPIMPTEIPRGENIRPDHPVSNNSNTNNARPGLLSGASIKVTRNDQELSQISSNSGKLRGPFLWFMLAEGKFIITRIPRAQLIETTSADMRLLEGRVKDNLIEFKYRNQQYRLTSQSSFIDMAKQPDSQDQPITIIYLPANLPVNVTSLLRHISSAERQQLESALGVTDPAALLTKLQNDFPDNSYISGATNQLNELVK